MNRSAKLHVCISTTFKHFEWIYGANSVVPIDFMVAF